jgi:type VI secretion system protein ImpJ
MPVVWEDGLFVQPHHLQHDAWVTRTLIAGLGATLHDDMPAWLSLEPDFSQLPWGRVCLTGGVAVLADGSCLMWPEQAELPVPLELPDPAIASGPLWIGLRSGGPGFSVSGLAEVSNVSESAAVYGKVWHSVPDMTAQMQPILMALMHRRSHLFQTGQVSGLAGSLCLCKLVSDGVRWLVDPAYCPPVLRLRSTESLVRLMTGFQLCVQARCDALHARILLGTRHARQLDPAALAQRSLLALLAGFNVRLLAMIQAPTSTPRQCHVLLSQTCAELQAFSGSGPVWPVSAFDRQQIHTGLQGLMDAILAVLADMDEHSVIWLPLTRQDNGLWAVRFEPGLPLQQFDFYLAVQAQSLDATWIAAVPQRLKLGALADIEKRLHSALPGIALLPAATVPMHLPVLQGRHYFALDRNSPLFGSLLDSAHLHLFCPDDLAGLTDLTIDVVMVRRESVR